MPNIKTKESVKWTEVVVAFSSLLGAAATIYIAAASSEIADEISLQNSAANCVANRFSEPTLASLVERVNVDSSQDDSSREAVARWLSNYGSAAVQRLVYEVNAESGIPKIAEECDSLVG